MFHEHQTLRIDAPCASNVTLQISDASLLQSPSVQESMTTNTDDEFAATDEHMQVAMLPSSPSPSSSRSRSRSNSLSESRVEKCWKKQQQYKECNPHPPPPVASSPSIAAAPSPLFQNHNLSPHNHNHNNDNGSASSDDDENFEPILQSYVRQESNSCDVRRSASRASNERSPSGVLGFISPSLRRKKYEDGIIEQLTRLRVPRKNAAELLVASPSPSVSHFDARSQTRHAGTGVKMHRVQRGSSYSSKQSEHEITPEPQEAPTVPETVQETVDTAIVAAPPPNAPIYSGSAAKTQRCSLPNLRLHPRAHAAGDIDDDERRYPWISSTVSGDSYFTACTQVTQHRASTGDIRGRRTSIRPGHRTHAMSTNAMTAVHCDIDGDEQVLQLTLDEVHEDEDVDEDDEAKDFERAICIRMDADDAEWDMLSSTLSSPRYGPTPRSDLIFVSTASAMMAHAHSDHAKALFAELLKMCIALKNNNALSMTIASDDKLLTHASNIQLEQLIDTFLRALGFTRNKRTRDYVCRRFDRVEIGLIDSAIAECEKCLQRIHQNATLKHLAHSHSQLKPLQNLTVLMQSESCEESIHFSDDEKDGVNENDTVQLSELIWSITHPQNEDNNAEHVLLLCYTLVTTAKYILKCLEARFFNDDHDGRRTVSTTDNGSCSKQSPTSPNTFTSNVSTYPSLPSQPSTSSSQDNVALSSAVISPPKSVSVVNFKRILSSFIVQCKVITFIQHWMNKYWAKDWHSDAKLLAYCRQFLKRAHKAYQSDSESYDAAEVQRGLRLLALLQKTIEQNMRGKKQTMVKIFGTDEMDDVGVGGDDRDNKSMKKRRKSSVGSFASSASTASGSSWMRSIGMSSHSSATKLPSEVMDVSHVILAEQLTITLFRTFAKIHPRECLKQAWKDKDRKMVLAPNVLEYIESFNRLVQLTQCSILVAECLKLRAKTIQHWIKVCDEFYKLRNFQALRAVVAALQSAPIYALKKAWSAVDKRNLQQYERFVIILKPSGNNKNLRRLQAETHPPMLPYFGLFCQDLIMIGEIKQNRTADHKIDWDQLRRIDSVIDGHLIYQNTAYANLSTNATVCRFLNKQLQMAGKLDADWLFRVSKNVVCKDNAKNNTHASPQKPRTWSFFQK